MIGQIHYGHIETSARLKRVLDFLLSEPMGATTRQIAKGASVCAVNSAIAELRANGYSIDCLFMGRKNGSAIFRYRLASKRRRNKK